MSLPITRPSVIGGIISAVDSDAISTVLDATGLPPGSLVFNQDVGAYFVLTISTASLDPDVVLAVKDTVGARWIIDAGGSGTVTTDGVSVEGDGSPGDPVSVIPSYIEGLVAPTLPKAGADLTDANATVNPASSRISVSTLPAATLSANRVLTLGVTGSPRPNSVFQVIRRDLEAHTYRVNDDAGTELITFSSAPSSPEGATFFFNDDTGHFELLNFFYVAV